LKSVSAENSGKPSAYAKAMEVIEQTLFTKALTDSTDIWNFISLDNIDALYGLVLREQKKENGIFKDYEPISYWRDGYCSAALSEYKSYLLQKNKKTLQPVLLPQGLNDHKPFLISEYLNCTQIANLKYQEKLLFRFVASLLTKPFVILTGLSGSGKTKLAESFSLWIAGNPDTQIRMVAVGADWTNREPLLGYPNALEPGRYVKPDSGALDLVINAIDNPDNPHFLILDEMNMSHVERYFADFLSAMESAGRQIALHPDTPAWKDSNGNWNDGVPAKIEIPKNLFIIGTVNIDETTYMFSPKVLDRAQVIEFRVSKAEMEDFLKEPASVDMEKLIRFGAPMGADFVAKAKVMLSLPENLPEKLLPFYDELQSAGAEFGYRTAAEISRFVAVCTDLAGVAMQPDDVIDAAIMQKLLPKVHGSRNKIEKILKLLGKRCLVDIEKEPFKADESGSAVYALSYEKIERMHRRVIADGFTSFAEA
jgi:5-methylcytosine-specific restriction protein B